MPATASNGPKPGSRSSRNTPLPVRTRPAASEGLSPRPEMEHLVRELDQARVRQQAFCVFLQPAAIQTRSVGRSQVTDKERSGPATDPGVNPADRRDRQTQVRFARIPADDKLVSQDESPDAFLLFRGAGLAFA